MKLKKLFNILLLCAFTLPAFAVSDKDMEDAKVIAAKLYLRWTNNASGYLDEINPSSMAELESKLKTQEVENLKAFKSVPIPGDYASWDKERFVQFWGTTFFTSPALTDDGKRAKDRVKAKVKTLKVAAPTAAPAAEAAATQPETATDNKAAAPGEEAITIPEPQEVVHQQMEATADSLAALEAQEVSIAQQDRPEKAKSMTWLYVVILIVLICLVVWLMVYAVNMMKKQGKESSGRNDSSNVDTSAFKKEIKALETANARLRDDNSRLKTDLEAAKAEIKSLRAAAAGSRPAQKATATEAAAPAPRPQKEEPKPQPKIINEIFLGRANPKGLFVRGDRKPNPDHTVFRLNTKDGIVGTFRYVETPESFALVTSNPLQFLAGGVICENFEDAETASRIITETPGTAILENGCWKVLRKSRIRFE